MATARNNRHQKDSGNHRSDSRKANAEPAWKAPGTERGLTHSPYFHGALYERMSEDLHLGGMSKRTHEGYLRAVRQLADYCKRSPDRITEDQLRAYFLYLKNQRGFLGPDGTLIRYRNDRTRGENETPFAETRTTIWHDTG